MFKINLKGASQAPGKSLDCKNKWVERLLASILAKLDKKDRAEGDGSDYK